MKRTIIVLTVAVLLFCGYFIFAPQELQSKWSVFIYPIMQFTVLMYGLRLFSRCRIRETYEINSEGLVFQDGNSRQRYRWGDIESYSFGDDKHIAGMRWLHFKATTSGKTEDRLFRFDPQEIEENKVHQILHEHLGPSREGPNA